MGGGWEFPPHFQFLESYFLSNCPRPYKPNMTICQKNKIPVIARLAFHNNLMSMKAKVKF